MISIASILLVSMTLNLTAGHHDYTAQASSPRQQLELLTVKLQQYPDNFELRERIMKVAQSVQPLPPVPDEARRSFLRGAAIKKNAPDALEMKRAVAAFKDATTLAPWWADAYYNLGLVSELAGSLASAERYFGIYLLSQPQPESVQTTRTHLEKIHIDEEEMFRQVSAGKVPVEALLDALDEAVYQCGATDKYYFRIAVRGHVSLYEYGVEVQPPDEKPPVPSPFPEAAFAAAEASDIRRGLVYMRPTGKLYTLSVDQVERQGNSTCTRLRVH